MTLRILCLVDAEALNASYHLSCEKKLAGEIGRERQNFGKLH
jgi:hypothetical protein